MSVKNKRLKAIDALKMDTPRISFPAFSLF